MNDDKPRLVSLVLAVKTNVHCSCA